MLKQEFFIYKNRDSITIEDIRNENNPVATIESFHKKADQELSDIIVKAKKISQFFDGRVYFNQHNPLTERVAKLYNQHRNLL